MARRGQVRRIDKITPFKSGTKSSALCVYFIYIADLIGLQTIYNIENSYYAASGDERDKPPANAHVR